MSMKVYFKIVFVKNHCKEREKTKSEWKAIYAIHSPEKGLKCRIY